MIRKTVTIIAAALTLSALPGTASANEEPLRVHLAPGGSSSNTGLTPESPVGTLEQAEQVIVREDPDTDVEVQIATGTYTAGPTSWNTYIYGHSISFMPAGYTYGDPRPSMPVFRSDGTPGFWFRAELKPSDPGGTTDLRFYYLTVTGYVNGLAFWGPTGTIDGVRYGVRNGINGNTVYGMRFDRIGSIHNPTEKGTGGVTLVNSDDNWVRNNHFVQLENRHFERGGIHALYLAHGADRNRIESNSVSLVTGSPMRFRNNSNDNIFRDNRFDRTGTDDLAAPGHVSEWFCGQACQIANPDSPAECGSDGNVFHDNTLGLSYSGGGQSMWYRNPPDLSEIGPCGPLNSPWLRTWGNIRP